MMAQDACRFNPEPILLRHPMSLVADDRLISIDDPIQQSHAQDCDQVLVVDQHLGPEQQSYEFPPKSRLQALAYLDLSDQDTFFDESSFTSTSSFAVAQSSLAYLCQESDYFNDLDHSDLSDEPIDRLIESLTSSDSYGDTNPQLGHMALFTPTCQNHPFPRSHGATQRDDTMEQELYLADDGRLSPLQLPTRVHGGTRHFTNDGVESPHYKQENLSAYFAPHKLPPSNHPTSGWADKHGNRRADDHSWAADRHDPTASNTLEFLMDDDSDQQSQDSHFSDRVVLLRLSKNATPQPHGTRCPTRLTCFTSDEGYDDDQDLNESPLESDSCFLDLSPKDQESMDRYDHVHTHAAITIQAAWRGYKTRKQLHVNSVLSPSLRVLASLTSVWTSLHRRQVNQLQEGICELEQRLEEETAMRTAFETATEDMALLMDQQQKMMHDRIEQEVAARQAYERQMDRVLDQLEPLEARLRKERAAHRDLENMMDHVLNQMHQMQLAQQQQAREEAAEREVMQRKLDEALATIASLKQTPPPAVPVKNPARSPPTPSRPMARPMARPLSRTSTRTSTPHTTQTPTKPKPTPSPTPRARPSVVPARAQSRASSRPATAMRATPVPPTTRQTTRQTPTPTHKTPVRSR